MKKLTPVIFVEEIEPYLAFWTDRLGLQVTVTVPEGERLGFVILARGAVEVMYQSRASVSQDLPALVQEPFTSRTNLYIEVESLAALLPRLEGAEIIVPLRKTFYGADEIGVRAPCGTNVLLSQFSGETP